MKANNTPSNLKGMAKHTYNRVMSAMAEDSDPAMLHTFAALTEGAKAIALQSGNFSNLYIRGINKGMTAEEAANELTERAAALVSRKLRKIDMICAAAFLAEYISRQRKEAEQPEPTSPEKRQEKSQGELFLKWKEYIRLFFTYNQVCGCFGDIGSYQRAANKRGLHNKRIPKSKTA